MLLLFPFTYCVYLWEQPKLHLVIILHSINKLNTNAKPKQNSARQSKKAESKEKRGREVFVTRRGNERWHADHLNAKAEGIDCERLLKLASAVCKTRTRPTY